MGTGPISGSRRLAAAAAAVAVLVVAVRLSGPRTGAPVPEAAPPLPAVEASRLPERERLSEAQRPPEPRPETAPPVEAPLLQTGDLGFGVSDERTPQGALVYAHRFYYPESGRGRIIENAVRVFVDGRDQGALPLPPPVPDAVGGPLGGAGRPARILRVPVGASERPHEVVVQFFQDQGRPRPAIYRHTYRREAGPRSDWQMIRSQWAPDGGAFQDLEVPRRMGSMGQ